MVEIERENELEQATQGDSEVIDIKRKMNMVAKRTEPFGQSRTQFDGIETDDELEKASQWG